MLFPNGTYEGYFIEDLIDFLPELQQRKPDWAEMDNFWWHIDDSAIRIKVLNELIEETK